MKEDKRTAETATTSLSSDVGKVSELRGGGDDKIAPERSEQLTTFIDTGEVCEEKRLAIGWGELWTASYTLQKIEMQSILGRPQLLSNTIDWQTSDAVDALLWNSEVPSVLASKDVNDNIMEAFAFFRYKAVEVSVRLQSTPWHYGALALYALPYRQQNNPYRDVADSVQYLNNNPTLISASVQTPVIKQVGWHLPLAFVPTNAGSIMNHISFCLKVVHPLLAIGASTPDVRLTIWGRFIEPEIMGPNATNAQAGELMDFTWAQSGELVTQVGLHNKKMTEAKAKSESGLLSSWREFNEGVRLAVDTVDYAVSKSSGMAPLLSMLDKPTSLISAAPVYSQRFGDMPHVRGLDNAVKLGADPEQQSPVIDGTLGIDHVNPTILSMVKIPGYILRGSFTGAAALSSKLFTVPVNPWQHFTKTTGLNDTFTPTYLHWYSRMFLYWRGGIKYKMKFYTSPYVTARVRVVWFPNSVTAIATTSITDSGDYVSALIDICGDTDYEFTVPWARAMFWANGLDDYGLVDDSGNAESNGVWALYIENTVVSVASTVTPTIYYSVWVAAADDYQLQGLRKISALSRSAAYTAQVIVGPEDFVTVDQTEAQSCIWEEFATPFAPIISSHGYVTNGMTGYDEVLLVTEPMKRACHTRVIPALNATIKFWPTGVDNPSGIIMKNIALDWWSAGCFLYFRGGRRFKVVVRPGVVSPPIAPLAAPFLWDSGAKISTPATGADTIADGPSMYVPSPACNSISYEIPWLASVPYMTIWFEDLGYGGYGGVDEFTRIRDSLTSSVSEDDVGYAPTQTITSFATCAADDVAVGCIMPPLVEVATRLVIAVPNGGAVVVRHK